MALPLLRLYTFRQPTLSRQLFSRTASNYRHASPHARFSIWSGHSSVSSLVTNSFVEFHRIRPYYRALSTEPTLSNSTGTVVAPSASPAISKPAEVEVVSEEQLLAGSIGEDRLVKTNVGGHDTGLFSVNEISIHGSVLMFPSFVVTWTPVSLADVTVESLSILEVLNPPIDIILFGANSVLRSGGLPQEVRDYLDRLGIGYDVYDAVNAAGLFNTLNEEDRRVAAALIASTEESERAESEQQDDTVDSFRKLRKHWQT